MEKFMFCIAMDGDVVNNLARFQESLTAAYVNGIEPLEYCDDTVTNKDTGEVKAIILLKCRQRWNGAAKRFFRKTDMSDLGWKKDDLHVFG